MFTLFHPDAFSVPEGELRNDILYVCTSRLAYRPVSQAGERLSCAYIFAVRLNSSDILDDFHPLEQTWNAAFFVFAPRRNDDEDPGSWSSIKRIEHEHRAPNLLLNWTYPRTRGRGPNFSRGKKKG